MKRVTLSCLVSALLLTACGGNAAHVDIRTRDITDAADKIKDGLTALESGVKDAAGNIDPIKIGRLLGDNEALRTQLASYQRAWPDFPPVRVFYR